MGILDVRFGFKQIYRDKFQKLRYRIRFRINLKNVLGALGCGDVEILVTWGVEITFVFSLMNLET